ncbi:YlbF family regulator [Sporolactobacillus vineae]|uniref:YlbF family regulator n=1 Tax=Sporolactobacillus vineae TaxID=444463 RepID=UPI0002883370|nr:YlbF family regulator [Sporolactobacillus vineae]
MIATTESVSLLDETDQLASMVIRSDVYQRYLASRSQVARSETAQHLIRQFKDTREKYDEVQRFGRYHPDFKRVIHLMMDVKRQLDMNPLIAEYKRSETDLNDLLGKISLQFARSVSDEIMVPTGDPFFDKLNHGGCGAGGKCGCRTRRKRIRKKA